MNYRVQIRRKVIQQIATLPDGLNVGVLQKLLHELPSDPSEFLCEVVVPFAIRSYPFTLQGKSGRTHWLVAYIDGIDPAASPVLTVVQLRHTEFDPSADA